MWTKQQNFGQYTTDENPLLLHTNMDGGHGGASGRYEQYRNFAKEFAFVLHLAERLE